MHIRFAIVDETGVENRRTRDQEKLSPYGIDVAWRGTNFIRMETNIALRETDSAQADESRVRT